MDGEGERERGREGGRSWRRRERMKVRERQTEFELVEGNKGGKEGKEKRKEDCKVEDRQKEFGLGEREDCENDIVVISFMSLFLIAVSGV